MTPPDIATAAGNDLHAQMIALGEAARAAMHVLASATAEQKNAALRACAAAIRDGAAGLKAANAGDMQAAEARGLTGAMLDRLMLDDARIEAMAAGLGEIAALDDPVGAVMAEWDRPNGLHIARVRVPLGVIGIIYESRPNVTADAGGLCLKSGNAAILRGGWKASGPRPPSSNACTGACAKPGCRKPPCSRCPPATAPPSARC